MKFLCLAYGNEKAWLELSKDKQEEFLAYDEVLRQRGDLVTAVKLDVVTVTAWDGTPVTSNKTFSKLKLPLAGFSIVEAENVDEVVRLVANTPCARAGGAIEIRPFLQADVA
jgi:hypothetical protein